MNKRTFIALSALALAGCGGGGSMQTTAPATIAAVSAPCNGKVVRIQLFGDSTMAGHGDDESTVGITPQSSLQKAMDQQFGVGSVTVESRAVGSTTSTQLVQGTDGLNQPWPGSVNADIVVMNHGINDSVSSTPAVYVANLHLLAMVPSGTTMVFETPLPIWQPTLSTSFAPEMRQVAGQLGITIADAGAYAQSIPTWKTEFDSKDGVHPLGAGYHAIVTNVLLPVLEPMVSALCSQ